MRRKSVALGRTVIPGIFESTLLAMSAAFGVLELKIALRDVLGDMAAARTRALLPDKNGSFRTSVNVGRRVFDAPFLRR